MRCIVCESKGWTSFRGELLRCKTCQFTRANDNYFNFDPAKLYGPSYFKESDYADYEKERPALEKNFKDRLKRISKYKKRGNLLEIGCAYGFFLALAKEKFSCWGIDLHPKNTAIAKKNAGGKILTGDFLRRRIPQNFFDVVCMLDTIEHLKSPEKHLAKVNKILKPGGIVVIETGDIDSLLAKLQGKAWRLIKPPFHLQYFSQKSLKTLLEKYGFDVLKVQRVAFERSITQTIYKLTNNQTLLRLLRPLFSITFSLNTGDLLFVIAQKPQTGRKN